MCDPNTADITEKGQFYVDKDSRRIFNSSSYLEWRMLGAEVHFLIQHNYCISIKLKVICLLSWVYCERKVIKR